MATTSAWAVGSFQVGTWFTPSPTIWPSRTITQPNGLPVRSTSALWRARAMARRMNGT